jgi:hypothetical protein
MSTEIKTLNGYPIADAALREQVKNAPVNIAVADIEGGSRITINYANGSSKTVDVMDGEKGEAGRGIASIARTSGNGAAGTTDMYTITYTDGTTSTFGVYNGKNGMNGTSVTVSNVTESTTDGGSNVVTFSDGNTLTVKNGSRGSDGSPGTDGKDGADGSDGFSPTVAVSDITGGHQINITDKDGVKTVDVMDGEDGASVTIKSIATSKTPGGENIVTFSDGQKLTVLNGKDGEKGDPGVHVGSSEPTGDQNVWIDPDGEPTGTETWEFTLSDGSIITKTVVVL